MIVDGTVIVLIFEHVENEFLPTKNTFVFPACEGIIRCSGALSFDNIALGLVPESVPFPIIDVPL